jgi:hypothetical protein
MRASLESGSATNRLTSGDCGDNTDFIPRLYLRLGFLEKTDVFVIKKYIHEAPDLVLIVADTLFQARISPLKTLDYFADSGAIGFYDLLILGQLSEGCRNSDGNWHKG